jgi:predicted DNA-binding protein YlxM (UPF0122 family)
VVDETVQLREAIGWTPQPIAIALGRVIRARTLPERLDAAIKAGEVLTRYLAVLALGSWSARTQEPQSPVDFSGFSGPLSFGHFLTLVQQIAAQDVDHPLAPYLGPAFRTTKKGKVPEGHEAIQQLLMIRNGEGHDLRHVDEPKAQLLMRKHDPVRLLATAVLRLKGILRLPVMVIEDQRLQGSSITATCLFLVGESPPFPERVALSSGASEFNVPYLATPAGLLDLSPGLVWDLVELQQAYGLFFIDRIDTDVVRYKAMADSSLVSFGHELLDVIMQRLSGSARQIEAVDHADGITVARWWNQRNESERPAVADSAEWTSGVAAVPTPGPQETKPGPTAPAPPAQASEAEPPGPDASIEPDAARGSETHEGTRSSQPPAPPSGRTSTGSASVSAARPQPAQPPAVKDPRLTSDALLQWFCVEGKSDKDVAADLGIPPLWVRLAAKTHGLDSLLAPSVKRTVLAPPVLVERYEDGAGVSEIARELKCSHTAALHMLVNGGAILRAEDSERIGGRQPRVGRSFLKREYLENLRTLESIGEEVGLTRERVRQIMKAYGLPTNVDRSAGGPDPGEVVPEAMLRQLYVVQGRSLAEIAESTGLRREQVAELASRYELARPRVYERHGLTKELIEELYVNQRMSVNAIADTLNVPRQAVSAAMEQHQIPTRSRASAMSRGLNEVLTKEYLEARLAEGVGPADIAADLETTVTTVRRYMAEAGLAPAAVPNPKYDGILPLSRIQQEFLDKDLTLAEFSAKVGVPQEEVRRRLQAAGLEVPRRRNTLLSRYPTEVTIREAAEMGAPAWFPVTAAELEALYVVEGRSTLEIAEQLDVDPMLVQRYLVAAGIDVRLGMADVLSKPYLVRRYVEEATPSTVIARDAGTTAATVTKLLRSYGVEVRGKGGGRRNAALDLLTEDFLRNEYERNGRSANSIARELGLSSGQVLTAVRKYRIPVRDSDGDRRMKNPGLSRLTPDYLKREYLDNGRSANSIAKELGVTNGSVTRALRDAGILPGASAGTGGLSALTEEYLLREYVEKGRSANSIAVELGVSNGAVSAALERFSIPRRTGSPNPGLGRLTEERLRVAYVEEGRSINSIATELGVSRSAVVNALERFGLSANLDPPTSEKAGT